MKGKRIILTGAAGGIASLLAQKLDAGGARLCLTDINDEALQTVQKSLSTGTAQTYRCRPRQGGKTVPASSRRLWNDSVASTY